MSSPMPKQNLPRTPKPPPVHEAKMAPNNGCRSLLEIKRHLHNGTLQWKSLDAEQGQSFRIEKQIS